MAAEKDSFLARDLLGNCYEKGIGTGIDLKKAFENSKLAAAHEYDRALEHLGICYELGLGTKKNAVQAFNAYLMAYKKSSTPRIIARLANCFRNGIGTKKNLGMALLLECEAGNLEQVIALCEKDNSIILAKDTFGNNALHAAALKGHTHVADFLMGKYPELLKSSNNKQEKPFLTAHKNGHSKLAKIMLNAESNPPKSVAPISQGPQ